MGSGIISLRYIDLLVGNGMISCLGLAVQVRRRKLEQRNVTVRKVRAQETYRTEDSKKKQRLAVRCTCNYVAEMIRVFHLILH